MSKKPTDCKERGNCPQDENLKSLNAKHLQMFAKMATEHHHRLQRYVRTLCHDEALCNDIVQDTFLSAQLQLERNAYDEQGKSWFWLCSIARNHLMDYYRHHSRRNAQLALNHTQICDNLGWSSEGSAMAVTLPIADNDAVSELTKQRERISDNIGVVMGTQFRALSLSEEERELLCMRYCDEQLFRELSERRGEPLSTVMSRYYTIMEKVRRQLVDLDARGLFKKELSLGQMRAYIRRKEEHTDNGCTVSDASREARQRDRMRKVTAYARRNGRNDDPAGVPAEVY